MTDNPYEAPKSDVLLESGEPTNKFYVVSKTKLSVLFIATFGLYAIYWFYVNWRNYRNVEGEKLWPVPRSIFYIFFTHSLFRKVDLELKQKGLEFKWSPGSNATLFVVISILSSLLDQSSFEEAGFPWMSVLSLALMPLAMIFLLKAQDAINLSQGDGHGDSNRKFTLYNYLWILAGVVFWAFVLMGMLILAGLIVVQ